MGESRLIVQAAILKRERGKLAKALQRLETVWGGKVPGDGTILGNQRERLEVYRLFQSAEIADRVAIDGKGSQSGKVGASDRSGGRLSESLVNGCAERAIVNLGGSNAQVEGGRG